MKCLLNTRLTLFRQSTQLWLESCTHCILAASFDPKNLNILYQYVEIKCQLDATEVFILYQTMVYVASIRAELHSI